MSDTYYSKTPKKVIPRFDTEEEELEFWDTHDPTEYFEDEPDSEIVIAARSFGERNKEALAAIANPEGIVDEEMLNVIIDDLVERHRKALIALAKNETSGQGKA